MNNITICIPTYKRHDLLEKLIESIAKNEIDTSIIKQLSLIVLDNDVEKSSEHGVSILKLRYAHLFKIHYYNYPIKGLANVRNELFSKALDLSPDFIVGVDDDEYVSKNWLNHLTNTILQNRADIAMGPVQPYFSSNVPKYISYHFRPNIFLENEQITIFESNNFIVSTSFILEHKLKFDSRFNFTGGEDAYFGVDALKSQAKIVWAKNAEVYEFIPEGRANLVWILKRKLRTSNCSTYIYLVEKDYQLILYKLAKSIFYLFFGLPLLFLSIFPFKSKYKGFIKIAEALGGITAFLNIRFNGY